MKKAPSGAPTYPLVRVCNAYLFLNKVSQALQTCLAARKAWVDEFEH